jgi:hypothetical protein
MFSSASISILLLLALDGSSMSLYYTLWWRLKSPTAICGLAWNFSRAVSRCSSTLSYHIPSHLPSVYLVGWFGRCGLYRLWIDTFWRPSSICKWSEHRYWPLPVTVAVPFAILLLTKKQTMERSAFVVMNVRNLSFVGGEGLEFADYQPNTIRGSTCAFLC